MGPIYFTKSPQMCSSSKWSEVEPLELLAKGEEPSCHPPLVRVPTLSAFQCSFCAAGDPHLLLTALKFIVLKCSGVKFELYRGAPLNPCILFKVFRFDCTGCTLYSVYHTGFPMCILHQNPVRKKDFDVNFDLI